MRHYKTTIVTYDLVNDCFRLFLTYLLTAHCSRGIYFNIHTV
nr:MAG TPA: hypothetical protein [Caudoviricetes sp.]